MVQNHEGTQPETPPAVPHDRILIVRPSALGDVCRTVPVLASLRAANPSAQIDWLVQDSFVEAISHHPALSRAVPFPRKQFGHDATRLRFGPVLAWLSELKRTNYDLVIDCQGLARSGLFTWWTRAPRRVGYSNAQEGAWMAYSVRRYADPQLHTVERMLRLVDAAGARVVRDMRLYAGDSDVAAVRGDPALGGLPYLLVAPTSRWPGKRWPQERFVACIRALLGGAGSGPADGPARVVLVGSASERPQCGELIKLAAEDPRVVDRIGTTSVGRLMALVQGASAVLCNDSAVLHMAVGFDRPIVALYGPTHVSRVGPYRREGDVIQHVREQDRIDHKDAGGGVALMARIGVDEVLGAVRMRLK